MIHDLHKIVEETRLSTSIENLEIKSPRKVQSSKTIDTEKFLPHSEETFNDKTIETAESNCFTILNDYEQKHNALMNNYRNYLMMFNFMNSNSINNNNTQVFPTPENHKDQQRETNASNPKIVIPSNLPNKPKNENDRRGSNFSQTSRAPDSKRPSNSFISLYLTPSISMMENDEVMQRNILELEETKEPRYKGKGPLFGLILEDNNSLDITPLLHSGTPINFPQISPTLLPPIGPFPTEVFKYKMDEEDLTPNNLGRFFQGFFNN